MTYISMLLLHSSITPWGSFSLLEVAIFRESNIWAGKTWWDGNPYQKMEKGGREEGRGRGGRERKHGRGWGLEDSMAFRSHSNFIACLESLQFSNSYFRF